MTTVGPRMRAMSVGLGLAIGSLSLMASGCGTSPDDSTMTDAARPTGDDAAVETGGPPSGTGGSPTVTGTGGSTGSGGAGPGASGGAAGGGAAMTGGASGSAGTGGNGTGGSATATGGRPGTGGAVGAGGAAGAGTANITIWLAGDSTVATGGPACPIGWGGKFQPHFNTHATVVNSAISGTSVNDWLYDVSTTLGADGECVLNSTTTFLPGWTAMLNGMKTGDYLFVQFGINDTDPTCPKHESTARFMEDLGMMAQAARERGANPVFLSSVSSIACTGNSAIPTRGRFADAARQAAVTYNVPLIDLEALSVTLYTSLAFCPLPGADVPATYESGAIGNFFCEDHTHFESAGATQIATLVAQAIKNQGFGLASYLVP
jgi:lysophospholipase L1-like esterase